jgi:hypothetical protein
MGMEPFVQAGADTFKPLLATIPDPVDNLRQALAFKVGLAAKQAETQQAVAQSREISRKLDRQQLFQQDLAHVQGNPSPQNVSALMMKYPEFADQVKGAWDVKDKAARDADLTSVGQVYAPALSGDWTTAAKAAHDRYDADKTAGQTTPEDDQFIKLVDTAAGGDKQAQKQVLTQLGMHAAAAAGPDHFASVYGALKGGYTLGPGEVRMDDNGNVISHSPMIKGDDGGLYDWNSVMGDGKSTIAAPNAPVVAGKSVTPAAAAVASTLTSAGLPAPVVAGFMGNFHVEGGYDGAQGDGGSASGIAQWHSDRAAQFEKVIGKPVTEATPAEQAQFVAWEMKNPEAAGMTVKQRDAIMAAKTPRQAAALIDQFYERSSGDDRQVRMSAADAFAGGGNSTGPRPLLPGKRPTVRDLTAAEVSSTGRDSSHKWQIDESTGKITDAGPAEGGAGGPLKPNALEPATIAYIKTGKMPAGMGGQALKNQILNNVPAIMDRYGLSADDIPSIQQQFGADSAAFKQRVGQLSYMRQSLGKLNQHAHDMASLIKAVPAQGFKPFNWITQGVEGQFSNSTITQLQAVFPCSRRKWRA